MEKTDGRSAAPAIAGLEVGIAFLVAFSALAGLLWANSSIVT
jgi:hypothetical protein